MDFTLEKYKCLLHALLDEGYRIITFEQYCTDKSALEQGKFVILRHDVDLKAENSLATAKIEHSMDVQASYFFRVVAQSNKPGVIKAIAAMGHEIGYHYEDMSICNGDTGKAIGHFETWLNYFRQYYPVKTICMHGAPRSQYDGKELWKTFDYHDFGIIGEPYFDVDFSKVFYLTDTGRRWDGYNVSIRDRILGYQDQWVEEGLVYHTTDDVVKAAEAGTLPKMLMMTTHPQRWTDAKGEWLVELGTQSVKNVAKRIMKLRQ